MASMPKPGSPGSVTSEPLEFSQVSIAYIGVAQVKLAEVWQLLQAREQGSEFGGVASVQLDAGDSIGLSPGIPSERVGSFPGDDKAIGNVKSINSRLDSSPPCSVNCVGKYFLSPFVGHLVPHPGQRQREQEGQHEKASQRELPPSAALGDRLVARGLLLHDVSLIRQGAPSQSKPQSGVISGTVRGGLLHGRANRKINFCSHE